MSYPFLNENPEGGSSVNTALFNWLIIGVVIWFSSPYLKMFFTPKEKVPEVPIVDEVAKRLDIIIDQNEKKGMDIQGLNSKSNEPIIVITPTPYIENAVEGFDRYNFGYSYYYPDLGGVNCHVDNWDEETGKCSDITASGKSWRQNMYRGVAVHYDILNSLPFGTLINVLGPEEVKGWYEVIDICPGCNPRYEGQAYFIDFLDDKQRLTWGAIVVVEVQK